MSVEAMVARKNPKIVAEDGTVVKNVSFKSLTTAAQFITGRSVNGNVSWRVDNKMSVKEYLETQK